MCLLKITAQVSDYCTHVAKGDKQNYLIISCPGTYRYLLIGGLLRYTPHGTGLQMMFPSPREFFDRTLQTCQGTHISFSHTAAFSLHTTHLTNF